MKKRRFPLLYLIPIVVLVVALAGGAVAKYVTTVEVGGTITFSASLAESVVVQEHTVTHNTDGSYTLNAGDENLTTSDVEYSLLIPGLDIPKDPFVKVTGKTPVAAYLFIEVTDTTPVVGTKKILDYSIDSTWTQVTDITDKLVYVYTGGGTDAVKITNKTSGSDPFTVPILNGNTVYVSDMLKSAGDPGSLIFTAKLVEVQENVAVKDHY